MKIYFETPIKLPFEKVRDQFDRNLFSYLSPKIIPHTIERFDGCKVGDEIHIKLGISVLSQKWVSLITFEESSDKGWSFVDEGKVLPWPLKSWKHQHLVVKYHTNECKIIDDIEYQCSSLWVEFLIKPFLWAVFAIRPPLYRKYFKE